ncbi:MFS transporter [Motilimonas cestriensis]|uniref:MFS transporter n=1 Tax=Motilimonas cestriensis TaxID=2742685 RepID=UPI003DA1F234
MHNPYSMIFKMKGTKAFSSAGFIARMPLSMMAIGLITMMSQLYDSYWVAGSIAAVFTFTMAFSAPQLSRLIDKYGQRAVVLPATMLSVVATLILLWLSYVQAPIWSLYTAAMIAGMMPSIPALVRARWSYVQQDPDLLNSAYSFESVLDEIAFVVGPPLSIALSTLVFPQAGPLLAIVLFLLGSLWLVSQSATEPKIVPSENTVMSSALRNPLVQLLTICLLALGVIVGAVDVLSVAFANQHGSPLAASIVLSMYALGSCISGFSFGALKWKVPMVDLLVRFALFTLLASFALLGVSQVFGLALVMFVAGLAFAPTMIIAMGLVEKNVVKQQLTEGLTWLITGLGMGIAIGAAVTGWVVENFTVSHGFWIAIAAAGCVVLISVVLYKGFKKNIKSERTSFVM